MENGVDPILFARDIRERIEQRASGKSTLLDEREYAYIFEYLTTGTDPCPPLTNDMTPEEASRALHDRTKLVLDIFAQYQIGMDADCSVLMKVCEEKNEDGTACLVSKQVVNYGQLHSVISKIHCRGGHSGYDRTFNQVKSVVCNIPRWVVRLYVSRCSVCKSLTSENATPLRRKRATTTEPLQKRLKPCPAILSMFDDSLIEIQSEGLHSVQSEGLQSKSTQSFMK
mmetsp:Transcript_4015/g.6169  ORF Transcript_4015/g.6169 Transcript_4015/m.6169 type:complete len:227 (+) Transcript_4015:86-766(+)